MFGWFSPKCPVELDQKVWTEHRMRWLADQLGVDRLRNARVILSLEEILPDDCAGRPEDARRLMERLAAHMGIRKPPEFEVVSQPTVSWSGLYIPGPAPKILIEATVLEDSLRLVTTIAHELAHEILLGGGLLLTTEPDHEQVTDLLLIYLGLGIIAANSTIKDRTWREGNMEYFQISRSGYLTSFDLGYALALFAFIRGEDKPAWTSCLRPDAQEVLRKGLRFLHATGDTLFHPDRLRDKLQPVNAAKALDLLRDGTPTEQLFALRQLAIAPLPDASVIEAVMAKLHNRYWTIEAAAAAALGALGKSAAIAAAPLLQKLDAKRAHVRASAAIALSSIPADPEKTVDAFVLLLEDTNPVVLDAIANALSRLGVTAQACVHPLLRAIDAALYRDPTKPTAYSLIVALNAIDPEPELAVREFYVEGNDEHLDLVLAMLHEYRQPADAEPA